MYGISYVIIRICVRLLTLREAERLTYLAMA
jgi:hypothetical protein